VAEVVVMPKLGLTAKEALLSTWLVEVGGTVAVGDPLCEIETDKITNEMESPGAGTLLARIDPDVVVPVGAPIAVIGAPGEDVADISLFATPAPAGAASAEGDPAESAVAPAETGVAPAPGAGRIAASPVARRRAEELGVPLESILGTGPGERITLDDVEAAGVRDTAVVSEEPSRLRRAIAEAMSLSAAIPQFTLEREVDVTDLLERLEGSADPQVPSVADAIGVAAARAIRVHSAFLRSWADGAFARHDDVHLGVAVAVDDGLIVPVVRRADRMGAGTFAAVRRSLQERTRAGKLASAEVTGAVFTISNLGPLGVDRFRALVNPPESAILGIGRVREISGRRIVSLSLSADHRVVDGAQGARLLGEIARQLEEASAELLADREQGERSNSRAAE
jgi:pyruvate dehydrogenase E2 component (dihydrolipoamide acetyltransferase)